jgi:hypothetical protein
MPREEYANQRDQKQKKHRPIRVHYLEGSGLSDCVYKKSFSRALFLPFSYTIISPLCQPVLIVGAPEKTITTSADSFVVRAEGKKG